MEERHALISTYRESFLQGRGGRRRRRSASLGTAHHPPCAAPVCTLPSGPGPGVVLAVTLTPLHQCMGLRLGSLSAVVSAAPATRYSCYCVMYHRFLDFLSLVARLRPSAADVRNGRALSGSALSRLVGRWHFAWLVARELYHIWARLWLREYMTHLRYIRRKKIGRTRARAERVSPLDEGARNAAPAAMPPPQGPRKSQTKRFAGFPRIYSSKILKERSDGINVRITISNIYSDTLSI